MVDMFKGIDAYKINPIHKNRFEQSTASKEPDGVPRVKPCFFLPRKETGVSAKRAPPKRVPNIVEVLAVILEGHSLVDHTEYKDRLVELITDDILKSVTSKHRVLRGLVLDELDKRRFSPPSKEVARVLAKMVGFNLMIVDAKRMSFFFAEAAADIPNTVVIGDLPMELYRSPAEARSTFENTSFAEELPFKTMKISELRAYAEKALSAKEEALGKREELVRRLEMRFSTR
jgi:hypothetical protein